LYIDIGFLKPEMLWTLILVVVLVLLGLLHEINAKTMWGARRKKEDSDEDINTNFVYRKSKSNQKSGKEDTKMERMASSKTRLVEEVTAKRRAKRQTTGIAENFHSTVEKIIEAFDSMLEMPNLDEILNVDTMQEVIRMFPQLESISEVQEVLSSDELRDPSFLKAKIQESFSIAKEYFQQMRGSLSDPQLVQQLLDELPPQAMQLLEMAQSGDYSGLISLLDHVPGITEAQKTLLSKLWSGTINSADVNSEEIENLLSEVANDATSQSSEMFNTIKSQMSDPEMVSQVRLQLLENPSLLQMMGLSTDILNDEEAFATLVAQQMSQLLDADPQEALSAIDQAINELGVPLGNDDNDALDLAKPFTKRGKRANRAA
jgi:hypothetical protein